MTVVTFSMTTEPEVPSEIPPVMVGPLDVSVSLSSVVDVTKMEEVEDDVVEEVVVEVDEEEVDDLVVEVVEEEEVVEEGTTSVVDGVAGCSVELDVEVVDDEDDDVEELVCSCSTSSASFVVFC